MNIAKIAGVASVAALLLLGVSQFVPYGKNHTNPPVVKEPAWNSPETRALTKRACFDCHSHETVWPWYSRIAPSAWLVYMDVMEGRQKLNFSDWQDGLLTAESPAEISKQVLKGKMPPIQYRLAHPEARLSPEERNRLVSGLTLTINGK